MHKSQYYSEMLPSFLKNLKSSCQIIPVPQASQALKVQPSTKLQQVMQLQVYRLPKPLRPPLKAGQAEILLLRPSLESTHLPHHSRSLVQYLLTFIQLSGTEVELVSL
jgi:hypothetical protein